MHLDRQPRTRLAGVLLAVAGLLALAGCGGGGAEARPEPSASATATATPESTQETTGPVRALFFGDSYIIGGPYTDAAASMGILAAEQLGWQAQTSGGGGTGFASGNPEYGLGTFLDQVEAGALDVGPVDWLVVEGGSNDKLIDPDEITRGAVETLQAAAERHPEARLVLVGTLDATVDDFTDTDPVIAALRTAAEQVGVPYVDAQRWLEGRPELVGPDFDHPLPAGHALLADRLADALRALGA